MGLDDMADGPRVETQLPNLVTAPASARAFLRSALQTWKLDGFGDVTELLTDELVSNAVRHVGAPMTIRAIWRPAALRIEVDDPSPEPPTLLAPNPFATSGAGSCSSTRSPTDGGPGSATRARRSGSSSTSVTAI